MSTFKNFRTCEQLVTQFVNESNRIVEKDLQLCIFGSDDDYLLVQPKYHTVFHCIEDIMQIVIACGCNVYVDVQPNEVGKLTPTLNIF